MHNILPADSQGRKLAKEVPRFEGAKVPGLKLFLLLIVSALIIQSCERSSSQSASSANDLIRGPYLQTGTPNSIVVRWRTAAASDSRVRYGSAPDNLSQFVVDSEITSEHEVKLSGLQAATKYYYAVGANDDDLTGSSDQFFVTAPPEGTRRKVRVWVLGDSGTANSNARSVRDAYYAFSGTTHTDLWVMLGDNAYSDGKDKEYQRAVFDMYPTMLRKSVLWPAFGNHDGHSANSRTQSGPFYDIFTLPANGEAGGKASGTEAYYSFNFANIHFVCLNSHDVSRETSGPMLSWLKEDLRDNTLDWTIAFWHHPPYSKGSHDSDDEDQLIEMRENAVPILEDGGADVVLAGHSHSYERSYLIDGHYGESHTLTKNMILDDGDGREDGDGAYNKPTFGEPAPHEGTVYVVAGTSGKTSGGSLDHRAMYISYNVLGSAIMDFNHHRLDLTFLDNDGRRLDYFTIVKGDSTVRIASTEISTFFGKEFQGMAALNWKTLQEVNAAGFEILRSTAVSGKYRVIATYRKIPALRAAGNSESPVSYNYTDQNLAKGVKYWYKLVVIGADGERQDYGPILMTSKQGK